MSQVVRIANTSLFPANVTLGVASAEDEEGKPKADAPFTPFIVEPSSLSLGVGQTTEVKVQRALRGTVAQFWAGAVWSVLSA